MDQNIIMNEARSWIGTRFQHQGRLKKTAHHQGGCDCLGLLIGMASALQLRSKSKPSMLLAQLDQADYLRFTHQARLVSLLDTHLDKRLSPLPELADILLFAMPGGLYHLAICSEYSKSKENQSVLGMIHSYSVTGYVTEHVLSHAWRRRLQCCYRLL